jgi:hypothetical protein
MNLFAKTITVLAASLAVPAVLAGPLDPDCTAEKAAKSAAMKNTVGVGGRCKPGETVKDTIGIDDKGPIENMRDDDGPVENMRDGDHDRKRDRDD